MVKLLSHHVSEIILHGTWRATVPSVTSARDSLVNSSAAAVVCDRGKKTLHVIHRPVPGRDSGFPWGNRVRVSDKITGIHQLSFFRNRHRLVGVEQRRFRSRTVSLERKGNGAG